METDQPQAKPYRVLARTYRPTTFSELIGQVAMVRTLTNAIAKGRLAHAFILTGVRGIGKTTTARLIARALNCVGADGNGGPTISPCGVCEHCVAIADDRHMDVMEMDAASRTGVDDIREVIDGVQYRPTSARTKIYIIDEIHMLSKNAFNALLKTLEEPPEHVKFIFATTESRKVPVTVLSRCQRFDLRRVDAEELAEHFGNIAKKEGATISDDALHLIARAADGSVRDGLSLLDQAIAHCAGDVGEDQVRAMVGLADRTRTLDLFEAVMKGEAGSALENLSQQYAAGADPAVVLEDMLELVHWLTRVKVVPEAADDPGVPEAERVRGRGMAGTLSMPVLTLSWQMLLKGLTEVRHAPSAVQAAEMVLIRLAHASTLPSPEEALKALSDDAAAQTTTTTVPSGGNGGGASAVSNTTAQPTGNGGGAQAALSVVSNIEPEQIAVQADEPETTAFVFTDFAHIAERATQCREGKLAAFLGHNARLVKFEPGRLEINGGEFADEVTMRRLRMFLQEQSGMEWVIINSTEAGAATLVEVQAGDIKAALDKATAHPLVQAVLETFPDASVESIERIEHNEHVEQNNEDDPTE